MSFNVKAKLVIFREVAKPPVLPSNKILRLLYTRKRNIVCSNKNYKLVVMKM